MLDIIDLVKDYDVITIFRHTSADPDALGSQFGMKYFLQNAFPEKEVYALGEDVESCGHMFDPIDQASDEKVASSIALILDCANHQRVDDQRYATAKKTVKIDHHPDVDDFTDEKLVNTKAAATCQILCSLFKPYDEYVDENVAFNLYMGLQADTMDFTTTNTSLASFEAAQFLLEKNVNPNTVKEKRSGMSLDEYNMVTYIRSQVKLDEGVGYIILNQKDYEAKGYTFAKVKEKVSVMANVNEFKIWVLFTEDPETHTYAGSFRSKREYIINDIAAKWQGGGHPNACGAKGFTLDTIDQIMTDFKNRIKEVDNK